jgi:hypothetical protein
MTSSCTFRLRRKAPRARQHWKILQSVGASLAISLTVHSEAACSFESDVHYGLTYWLAQQAGFDRGEAEAIALGDQRVDGGLIENMKSQLQYACFSAYAEDARAAQALHFPSNASVPVPAARRAVMPDSAQASISTERLLTASRGKSGFMLQLFGKSLHPLQDAFAHQGVPSVLSIPVAGVQCDARLSMSAPAERQLKSYHDAEITSNWASDVVRMARATYDALLRYPAVDGRKRIPSQWDSVSVQIDSFSRGTTKVEKATWFKTRGFTDVSFLDGISLPDGRGWVPVRWDGRKLPDIKATVLPQQGVDPQVLDFYHAFLSEWLTGIAKVGKLARFIKDDEAKLNSPNLPLELKLWLWRLRDHGAAVPLLFDESGSRRVRVAALALTRRPDAFAQFSKIPDAVLPLLIESDAPSPILPFIVFELSKSAAEGRRAVAILRLLDAPYETVAVVAEQTGGQWAITSIFSTFDY